MELNQGAQLDALGLAEALKDRLVDFALADARIRDPQLLELARRYWSGPPDDGGLRSELWVEAALPALRSDKTLSDLVGAGVMDPWLAEHLEQRGAFPPNRRLFTHQLEAIQTAAADAEVRPAVLVSAGTGAGKTEAFLLPVLQELLRRPQVPGGGIRALILYPMNALVNDQVDRLYGWLQEQSRLRLFHFTSETPEDRRKADGLGIPRWDVCRARTRQEARGLEDRDGKSLTPDRRRPVPDILITNYSMLEYMLCRPQDRVFFGQGLQAVVLDEAHLYTSTLAAEISLLLRRLHDRCGVGARQVLHLAASATIGGGQGDALRTFLATLFSRPVDDIRLIQGREAASVCEEPDPPAQEPDPEGLAEAARALPSTVVLDGEGRECIVRSAEGTEGGVTVARMLVGEATLRAAREAAGDQPARFLDLALRRSPLFHRLDGTLRQRRHVPLAELARLVWGEVREKERGTTALLGIAASARGTLDEPPILPHRLHLLVRPPEGLALCPNPVCSAPGDLCWEGRGTLLASRAECCLYCGGSTVSVVRCAECGEPHLACTSREGRFAPVAPRQKLTPGPGSQVQIFQTSPTEVGRSRSLDGRIGRVGGSGAAGLPVWQVEACGSCQGTEFAAFSASAHLLQSLAAETLLAQLPPLPTDRPAVRRILPAEGRRLIAFSDSRMEAARLGPRLRMQHERQVIRVALLDSLGEGSDDLGFLEEDLQDARRQLERTTDAKRREYLNRKIAELEPQVRTAREGESVERWSERLAESPLLEQVMAGEQASRHRADSWSQKTWEENRRAVSDHATEFLFRELAMLPNRTTVTLETLGLVEVRFPGLGDLEAPGEVLGLLPSASVRAVLQQNWTFLLEAIVDTLRMEASVTTGSPELDWEFFLGRLHLGHFTRRSEFTGKTERHRRRRFVSCVLEAAGVTDGAALALPVLQAIWEQLAGRATPVSEAGAVLTPPPGAFSWLHIRENVSWEGGAEPGLRVYFPSVALARPTRLYRCRRRRTLWSRSVLGSAPEFGSLGTLEPIEPEELQDASHENRLRREYTNSPIFRLGLWAEEHSAQLGPQEARRLQELFRLGARNVLSATTTLELGIDIGGLSAALLGNVPPGKANYLQRAGRVGRRADGSSVVVTCARQRPYDREVFRRFGDYLGRPLREPRVFLDRPRVVVRHLGAWLMGEFFRLLYRPEQHMGAMEAFGRMGVFCGRELPHKWDGSRRPPLDPPQPPLAGDIALPPWWVNGAELEDGFVPHYLAWLEYVFVTAEEEFRPRLESLFADTAIDLSSCWGELHEQQAARFQEESERWLREYEELLDAWRTSKDPKACNALRHQLRTLYETPVIEVFADARLLPRYGFPIGLQKLMVRVPDERGRSREESGIRLERAGLLAMREYVPGASITVGGRTVTSRGLRKHWTGANLDSAFGLRGQLAQCQGGHSFYAVAGHLKACPVCGEPPAQQATSLLFPRHGFTTAAWDPPRSSTEFGLVGEVEALPDNAFEVGGRSGAEAWIEERDWAAIPGVTAWYREEGEVLVYNRGEHGRGFALCTKCGYGDSEIGLGKGKMNLPKGFADHANLLATSRRQSCWKEADGAPVLRNHVLAAREPTDLLVVDISAYLSAGHAARNAATTLSVALQIAGAKYLELDSRDLQASIGPAPGGAQQVPILYDNVPGGAGHVLELMKAGRPWLERARDLLYLDAEHHERCRHACLDCLLTFDAQMKAERGELDRRRGLEVLDRMLQ